MRPWWVFLPAIVALAAYLLFVVRYAARSAWMQSLVGKSLMLSKIAIVLLLSHLILVFFWPYSWRNTVWAALFWLLAAGGWFQVTMLLRLQRRISNGENPRRRATDIKERKP